MSAANHTDWKPFLADVCNVACDDLGGATFWVDGRIPEDGYLVGVGGARLPKNTSISIIEKILVELLSHANMTYENIDGIGIWKDSKFIYLDLVEWVHGIKQAVTLGVENKELAIWDVKHGEALNL